MADPNPVRVRTTVTANPPLQGVQIPPTVSSVIDPADLARAIREGVDARLRDVAEAIREHGGNHAPFTSASVVIATAPREPAQEQEGNWALHTTTTRRPALEPEQEQFAENAKCSAEPAQERQEAPGPGSAWAPIATRPDSDDLMWFLSDHDGDITIDGPRRAWPNDAEQWDFWAPCEAPPYGAPTPDPLLPGLRAGRERWKAIDLAGYSATMRWDQMRDWLDAEIARREGA